MRRVYIFRGKECIEVTPMRDRPVPEGVAPAIRPDTINKTYCHGTGKFYESRSQMELERKIAGVEVVDSNYQAPVRQEVDTMPEIRDELLKAYYDLRDGRTSDFEGEDRQILQELNERHRRRN